MYMLLNIYFLFIIIAIKKLSQARNFIIDAMMVKVYKTKPNCAIYCKQKKKQFSNFRYRLVNLCSYVSVSTAYVVTVLIN